MRTETVKSERRDAQPLPLLISHQKLAKNAFVGGGVGADIINGGTDMDTLNAHARSDHVRGAPHADGRAMDPID